MEFLRFGERDMCISKSDFQNRQIKRADLVAMHDRLCRKAEWFGCRGFVYTSNCGIKRERI